jgi:hypothetical protein
MSAKQLTPCLKDNELKEIEATCPKCFQELIVELPDHVYHLPDGVPVTPCPGYEKTLLLDRMESTSSIIRWFDWTLSRVNIFNYKKKLKIFRDYLSTKMDDISKEINSIKV